MICTSLQTDNHANTWPLHQFYLLVLFLLLHWSLALSSLLHHESTHSSSSVTLQTVSSVSFGFTLCITTDLAWLNNTTYATVVLIAWIWEVAEKLWPFPSYSCAAAAAAATTTTTTTTTTNSRYWSLTGMAALMSMAFCYFNCSFFQVLAVYNILLCLKFRKSRRQSWW